MNVLLSPFFKYLVGAGVLLSVVVYVYLKGVDDAVQGIKEEQQKEFVSTTKRIQNAPTSTTRDDALDKLRDMGDLR